MSKKTEGAIAGSAHANIVVFGMYSHASCATTFELLQRILPSCAEIASCRCTDSVGAKSSLYIARQCPSNFVRIGSSGEGWLNDLVLEDWSSQHTYYKMNNVSYYICQTCSLKCKSLWK